MAAINKLFKVELVIWCEGFGGFFLSISELAFFIDRSGEGHNTHGCNYIDTHTKNRTFNEWQGFVGT